MLKNEYGVAGRGGVGTTTQGWAGHQSVGGEQLHCASVILYTLSLSLFLFLFCPIRLSLSQPTSFYFFFYFFFPGSLPHPSVGGRVSERLCSALLPARLNHNTPLFYCEIQFERST